MFLCHLFSERSSVKKDLSCIPETASQRTSALPQTGEEEESVDISGLAAFACIQRFRLPRLRPQNSDLVAADSVVTDLPIGQQDRGNNTRGGGKASHHFFALTKPPELSRLGHPSPCARGKRYQLWGIHSTGWNTRLTREVSKGVIQTVYNKRSRLLRLFIFPRENSLPGRIWGYFTVAIDCSSGTKSR